MKSTVLLPAAASALSSPSFGAERKGRLQAGKALLSRAERTDYAQCRKKAFARAQKLSGEARLTFTKRAMARCRDQFPAASILIECKRQAVKATAGDGRAFKEALAACRAQHDKVNFNPESMIPFSLVDDKTYFAGAGMNVPLAFENLKIAPDDEDGGEADFGNFSCGPLAETSRDPSRADYVLFGNAPQEFTPLTSLMRTEFLKIFKTKKANRKPDSYFTVAGFGHVYGDIRKNTATVFFPASYCFFNRSLGRIYEAIKVYYLIDAEKSVAVPYFAIAFYKPSAKDRPMPDLVSDTLAALGGAYKPFKNKKGVVFIARSELVDFDEEGDPQNVCAAPRGHELIVAIKPTSERSKRAEYLLLSNIANLCKYGDRLASRLVDKKSK